MEHQEQIIYVVPRCPVTGTLLNERLPINKLCFWYSENCCHQVGEATLTLFLKHVNLYGAFVHPEEPDKGCISLNAEHNLISGQMKVAQIYFNGQLVFNG